MPHPVSKPKNLSVSMKMGLIGLGGAGLVAWVARYALQPVKPVYTDLGRSFWLPDEGLGYILSEQTWALLGLDGLGVSAGLFVAGLIGLWWGAKALSAQKAYGRSLQLLGAFSLIFQGIAGLAIAGFAFATGFPPVEAQANKPALSINSDAKAPADALPIDAEEWVLADSNLSFVSANITAGGERFEARFAPISAKFQLKGANVTAVSGEVVIDATTVNTGVALRNQHAAEYLLASEHKQIKLSLAGGASVFEGSNERERGLSLPGQVHLMGRVIPVELKGTLASLTTAQLKEYNLSASEALLVNAEFSLNVGETPLDPKLFDASSLTLSARLLLAPSLPAAP